MKIRQVLAGHIKDRMLKNPDLDTQTKLSKAAGVTQSTVWRVLEAQVGASVDVVEAIAGALGVSPVVLLADKSQAQLLQAWDQLREEDRQRVLAFMQVTISSRPSNMANPNHWIDEQPIAPGFVAATTRATSRPPKGTKKDATHAESKEKATKQRHSA
jgi:transcriptional regulator with XRE-family HTH domain